jgi:hypothetical protein
LSFWRHSFFLVALFAGQAHADELIATPAAPEPACRVMYQKIGFFHRLTADDQDSLAKVKVDQVFPDKPFVRDGHPEALQLTDEAQALFKNHFNSLMKVEARSGRLPAFVQSDWIAYMKDKYPPKAGGFPGGWLADNAENLYNNYLKQGKTLEDFYLDQWFTWYTDVARHQVANVQKALELAQSHNNFMHLIVHHALRVKGYGDAAVRDLPRAIPATAVTWATVDFLYGPVAGPLRTKAFNKISSLIGQAGSAAEVVATNLDSQKKEAMQIAYQKVDLQKTDWSHTNYSQMPSTDDPQGKFMSADLIFRTNIPTITSLVNQVNPDFDKQLLGELQQNLPLLAGELTKADTLKAGLEDRKKSMAGASAPPKDTDQAQILQQQSNLDAAFGELAVILSAFQMYRFMHPSLDGLSDAAKTQYQHALDQYISTMQLDNLKNETLKRLSSFTAVIETSGLITTIIKPKASTPNGAIAPGATQPAPALPNGN